jgi:hypothetical protein
MLVQQSGYILISGSGPTIVLMSALWVVLSRPMPASLVVAIEKILLFDEAIEFDRLGCSTPGQCVS